VAGYAAGLVFHHQAASANAACDRYSRLGGLLNVYERAA
jgi:hypothetical protein